MGEAVSRCHHGGFVAPRLRYNDMPDVQGFRGDENQRATGAAPQRVDRSHDTPNPEAMTTIGEKILDEIIKQGMVSPHPETPNLLIWSANCAEQLDAVVANSIEVQIPQRLSQFYGTALQMLGAPDSDSPEDLIQWASDAAKRLRS